MKELRTKIENVLELSFRDTRTIEGYFLRVSRRLLLDILLVTLIHRDMCSSHGLKILDQFLTPSLGATVRDVFCSLGVDVADDGREGRTVTMTGECLVSDVRADDNCGLPRIFQDWESAWGCDCVDATHLGVDPMTTGISIFRCPKGRPRQPT